MLVFCSSLSFALATVAPPGYSTTIIPPLSKLESIPTATTQFIHWQLSHHLLYAKDERVDMSNDVLERRTHQGHGTERALCEKSRGNAIYTHMRVRERRVAKRFRALYALTATVATLPSTVAQNCISLADSSECRAFSSASISTDSDLTGLFPFLSNVTDASSFDTQLQQYISNGFTQQRYSSLIGCSDFDLANSSEYYARYTTSVLCNAMVQNSISPCDLTGNATRPLCANTCVRWL